VSEGFAFPYGLCPACGGTLERGAATAAQAAQEAIRHAFEIELGGMALYAQGAAETGDAELRALFQKLAEMEQEHLNTLSARYHVDSPKLDEGGIGVAQIAVYGDVELKARSAEELLLLALRLEQRARDFFAQQARSLEEGSPEWRLYRELEAEEWDHVALIDTELGRFREGRTGAL
jgi:rubrerythrin